MPLPRVRLGAPRALAWLQALSYRTIFWAVLGVAFLHGLLYVATVPPWQHYDEPTHFEYAWLIANTGSFPSPGDENPTLRREVLSTLFGTGFFERVPAPSLLTSHKEVWLGVTELGHPPLYYALISLPLRLVSHLDVLTQLYVARLGSLLLFLATIAVAFGLMRDLLPERHPLRWAVPLTMALTPTFADVMTSVNSDVGAAFVGSLFLWAAVRLVRYGLGPWRLLGAVAAVAVGIFTKNTTSIMIPLLGVALGLAVVVHHARVRLRWAGVACAALALALGVAALQGGDAFGWYRWASGDGQRAGTQVLLSGAPVGGAAIENQVGAESPMRQLISPVMPEQVQRISGRTVTVGVWMWATSPDARAQVGLRYAQVGSADANIVWDVDVGTEPRFFAWTTQIPQYVQTMSYMLYAEAPPDGGGATVYADGVMLAPGWYDIQSTPQFADADATQGTWGGRQFVNMVRNGSGEQSWLRLRPWIDDAIYHYIHRSPAQILSALLDVERVGWAIVSGWLPLAFDSFAGWFGWGGTRLTDPAWVLASRLVAGLAAASALWWLAARRRSVDRRVYAALLLLALAGALAWANVVLRPLPSIGSGDATPIARYTFPAIIPSALLLAGGIWALPLRRHRPLALLLFLLALASLDVVSLLLIRSYFL